MAGHRGNVISEHGLKFTGDGARWERAPVNRVNRFCHLVWVWGPEGGNVGRNFVAVCCNWKWSRPRENVALV